LLTLLNQREAMGDRANIVLHYSNKQQIYLYTHWRGYCLPSILQSALKRGYSRWNDESYLARIIFSEMIQNEVLNETGYGLSTVPPDNQHSYINVYLDEQRVEINGTSWDFYYYTELEESEWNEHYQ